MKPCFSTLVPLVALCLGGCPAPRNLLDSGAEIAIDVETDTGVFTDATDVSDARDGGEAGMDAGMCTPQSCATRCIGMGFAMGGTCSSNVCVCLGTATDAGSDIVAEMPGVTMCTSNADCPSSTFCNGPGCTAPGYCYPRGEPDAATCGTTGPAQCGCDRQWYPNECARQSVGVRYNTDPTACGPAPDAGFDAAAE